MTAAASRVCLLDLVRQRLAGEFDGDLAVLQRRVEQEFDDAAFELAHRTPYVLGDEPQDVVGDRELEVVLLGLLAENRDAVLEVRLTDVGHHAPLEAADEPRLEAGDLLRRPVGRQHDLLAGLVERIEGVEELLLGHFLALQEVHVVHQEHVHVAPVLPAELRHVPPVDALDDLVDELLGAHIGDPGLGLAGDHGVGDGLHQVRLAEAGGTVDEERVVRLPGRLGHGMCGCGGQFVGLADDERLEQVPLVERRRLAGDGCPGTQCAGDGTKKSICGRDARSSCTWKTISTGLTEHGCRQPGQRPGVLGLVPLDRELIGSGND